MSLTKEQTAIAEALFAQTFAVTVGKRSGNGVSREIPLAKMPANAWLKIVSYGVQRTFNDAIGGSDTTQAEKLETVDKMIAAYLAGEIGRARAAGRSPIESEIISIMRGLVKAEMDETEFKSASLEDDFDDTLLAIFEDQSDDDKAAIRASAEEVLAAKAAAKKSKSGLKLGKLAKLAKLSK